MSYVCAVKGCGEPASFFPVLELRVRHNGPAAEAALHLPTCTGHAGTVKLKDVFGNKQYVALCTQFRAMGKEEPRRDLTTLRWDPIAEVPGG